MLFLLSSALFEGFAVVCGVACGAIEIVRGAVELLDADSCVPPEIDGDGNRYGYKRTQKPLQKGLGPESIHIRYLNWFIIDLYLR
jgi:hypothetical protein